MKDSGIKYKTYPGYTQALKGFFDFLYVMGRKANIPQDEITLKEVDSGVPGTPGL